MKNKYHAVRSEFAGRSFDSKGERDCYQMLLLMQKAGEISNIECQVSVRLGPNKRRWIMDFKYFDNRLNEEVWADFKGFETDRWQHLLDLWTLEGPARLRVYKGKGLQIVVSEEIIPNVPAK
jgi:Protein of unknown function (DUF1064)